MKNKEENKEKLQGGFPMDQGLSLELRMWFSVLCSVTSHSVTPWTVGSPPASSVLGFSR